MTALPSPALPQAAVVSSGRPPIGVFNKLRLAPLWPALVALGIATALLWGLLPGVLADGAARQLIETARLLAPILAERRTPTDPDLERQMQSLASGSQLRITILRTDGRVLADTHRSPELVPEMENHLSRPEVQQALARGEGHAVRRSATTGLDYAYAALLVRHGDDPPWLLRLAQPVEQLAALYRHLRAITTAAALLALVVLVATAWWLDRTLFRPLAGLIAGAGVLATGDLQHELEVPAAPELHVLASALNRLGGQVERQIAALAAERDHLRAILASMAEGVLVVDRRRRARLANPSFVRQFRIAGEVEGRTPLDLARQPALADLVERTLAQGAGERLQLEPLAAEGRALALQSAVLPDGDGVIVVASDVTELERANRTRRDFVANVSHELKTPLAAIRGYAETLADGAVEEPATARRFLDRILEQCQRLEALLADLLTLSRLEQPEALAETETVDLVELARHAIELVAQGAQERQVEVQLVAAGAAATLGDTQALERLLVNLLDNGVKYNRPGGHVRVGVESVADGAVLTVADDGIGIPREALPRIFERFFRVDKGRSRDEGGTGLGLAIVKHVAQAHGGRVEVESELGRGSTFRVRLPASTAPQSET